MDMLDGDVRQNMVQRGMLRRAAREKRGVRCAVLQRSAASL
jgi:hypothetical protein